MKFIGTIVERIFVVLMALLWMQAPLFMQNYKQQLVGRVDELRMQVQVIKRVAGERGIEAYVARFTTSADPDFAAQGTFLHQTIERYYSLERALLALSAASVWERPYVFLFHLKADVASSTLAGFEPGLPFTVEGAAYALFGVLLGLLLSALWHKGKGALVK